MHFRQKTSPFFRFLCILLLVMLLYSCKRKLPFQNEKTYSFLLEEGKPKIIAINNTLDSKISFQYFLNDLFYLSLESIVGKFPVSSDTLHIDLWRWTCEYTTSEIPYTGDLWWNSPRLFINSSGYGFCDDKATFLAAVWEAAGYTSRIWMLEGHVVPEVQVNGRWEMYDPYVGTFFTNESGQSLSVEAIAKGEIHQIGTTKAGIFLEPDSTQLKKTFYDCFASQEDNSIKEWVAPSPLNSTFILPAKASIECCRQVFWPNGTQALAMDLWLPPGTKDEFYIPLILLEGEGAAELASDQDAKYLKIRGKFSPETLSYPKKYRIIQVEDSTRLTFTINNRLNPFKEGLNELILSGKNVGGLNISEKPFNLFSLPFFNSALLDSDLDDPNGLKHWLMFDGNLINKKLNLHNLADLDSYFSLFLNTSPKIDLDKNALMNSYFDRKQKLVDFLPQEGLSTLLSKLKEPKQLYFIFHEYFYSMEEERFRHFLAELQRSFQITEGQ